MTDNSTNSAAAEIAALVRTVDYGPGAPRLLLRLARMVGRGRPVTDAEVAGLIDELGLDRDQARKHLTIYAERNDNGEIIGVVPGITLRETPHRFTTDTAQMWAWCAQDTLVIPIVLGQQARVVTISPASKQTIRFTASHRKEHEEYAAMSTPSITDLKTTWSQRDYSTNSASPAAIDLLADGKPATPEALAKATGWSMNKVTTYIEEAHRSGAEVENGAIVGLALTLRPTQHRFRVRGNDLYTWCGYDALFLPIILDEQAEVVSTCPVTGTEIRLTVEPDGTVSAATPNTVVVGIVGQEVTSCCPVSGPDSAVCTQMPFFASREAGEQWLVDHSGVAIADLDDAREIARTYVQQGSC